MFNPSGIKAKIVSKVDSKELETDVRPVESTSPISLELSLFSQSNKPITISSSNELRVSLPLAESHGYDFGNKEITLNINGNSYDVKQLTGNGTTTGIIELPDL